MSQKVCESRTFEEVDEVLSLAKFNREDLLPVSQTIYFANNPQENNIKFLELDKYLQEQLKEGEKLYIKGNDEEPAVLCTKSHTYSLLETETSNNLLLCENLKGSKNIEISQNRCISTVKINGIFNSYLEVIPKKPDIRFLKEILETTAYRGPEYESLITDKKYTFNELLESVQISEDELTECLKQMHCFVHENFVRTLDFEYHFRVLTLMMNFIEENSWDLDKIDYEETRNELSSLVLPEILDALFDYYAEESNCIDGLQLYEYNQKKICQFFATVLLSSSGKFNLEEFLTAWSESVPQGMIVHEDMLLGIAVVDRKAIPPIVREFKEETLPDNITERLKLLFDVKDKWTLEEISPYIERLTTVTFDATALLAKHARVSKINGIKYYSSKHGR